MNRRAVLGGIGGAAALAGLSACAPGDQRRDAAATGTGQAIGDSKFALVLLGTQAGPPVVADRTGIASALVVDGRVYIIDCGRSATTQYLRAGLHFRNLNSIFLTHLHADHLADYYNFSCSPGTSPTHTGTTSTARSTSTVPARQEDYRRSSAEVKLPPSTPKDHRPVPAR
ncbi:MBL fold metallo-hydrolase [Saccharopolyspora sp. TS4A08]|uniref:MBL fold metallo-hydrolase n=1 Tax=Saccharopolyspora ipomoeae TaxID=3042027 RepID=A0ABT6PQL0_9PSEU|nr:MBL fold metallo-hydrolase [Saccharopolyspora sp. TS4A08]MDI2030219.1 MBL fold metallo-hydrolase [Saccharopolyspora sp. TS4A08]